MAKKQEGRYRFLTQESVRAAWRELSEQGAHTHFLGYLCVREEAQRKHKSSGLQPNFRSFFDRYLRVGGLDEQTPYIKPFGGPLQNKNVAGSYAPSSLRGVAPLLKVVKIEPGGRANFSLRTGHVDQARKHLLYGRPLAGVALATFLYRDYGFLAENPQIKDLLAVMNEDFGLSAVDHGKLFSKNFSYKGEIFE